MELAPARVPVYTARWVVSAPPRGGLDSRRVPPAGHQLTKLVFPREGEAEDRGREKCCGKDLAVSVGDRRGMHEPAKVYAHVAAEEALAIETMRITLNIAKLRKSVAMGTARAVIQSG